MSICFFKYALGIQSMV